MSPQKLAAKLVKKIHTTKYNAKKMRFDLIFYNGGRKTMKTAVIGSLHCSAYNVFFSNKLLRYALERFLYRFAAMRRRGMYQ